MEEVEINRDFRDLFQCFNDAGVNYLVVGAYAVIYHTEPRYTKDLDLWVEPTRENATRVWAALARFGAPMTDLAVDDLCNPKLVYQVGIEPNRFDILMGVKGLTFSGAWDNRIESRYDDQRINVLSHSWATPLSRRNGNDDEPGPVWEFRGDRRQRARRAPTSTTMARSTSATPSASSSTSSWAAPRRRRPSSSAASTRRRMR